MACNFGVCLRSFIEVLGPIEWLQKVGDSLSNLAARGAQVFDSSLKVPSTFTISRKRAPLMQFGGGNVAA